MMYDTASMTACSDYIEMAQLLGDAALPAEAKTVLEKAMSTGLILDQQKGTYHAPIELVQNTRRPMRYGVTCLALPYQLKLGKMARPAQNRTCG